MKFMRDYGFYLIAQVVCCYQVFKLDGNGLEQDIWVLITWVVLLCYLVNRIKDKLS